MKVLPSILRLRSHLFGAVTLGLTLMIPTVAAGATSLIVNGGFQQAATVGYATISAGS